MARKSRATAAPGDTKPKRPPASSKVLLKELPSEEKMAQTVDALQKYGHQTTALMGAAYLEHALEFVLASKFRPLDKEEYARMFDGAQGGILGGFAAKIRISYAANLLAPKPYHALLLINDIRNVFAHSLHRVSFNNKHVKRDCEKLASLSDPLAAAAVDAL